MKISIVIITCMISFLGPLRSFAQDYSPQELTAIGLVSGGPACIGAGIVTYVSLRREHPGAALRSIKNCAIAGAVVGGSIAGAGMIIGDAAAAPVPNQSELENIQGESDN